MNPSTRRRLAFACFAIAAILLGYWMFAALDTRWFQDRHGRRLDGLGRGASGSATAVAARREAGTTGLVGRIEVPRLGLSVMVGEGTSGRVLRRGVGHVSGTSFPGERGNVGLAGHRDTHFRKLKDIATGDLIQVRTADGVFAYRVDSILIVRPDRGDLLRSTGEPILTLVTCYPFHFIGPAPKRFVVRARRTETPGDLTGPAQRS